jgi:hypothetical protein
MMRSPLASRTLAFAFVLALAACGGGAAGTGGGGGSGGAPSCAQVADCPQPENDCQLAACNGGACGLEPKPEGALCLQGAGTCDGNGQCNLCEPGFATCNGSTLLVCGESGTFDAPITCGGDTPYCDPADPKCVGCFDTSQCVTPGMNPCLAVACLDNACVTTLVPDGSACVANGETGVCSDGMCLQCVPGEQTCSGDSLLTCGPDGVFDAAPCAGATPLCDPAALACVECLAASDCGAVGDPCGTPACLSGACSSTNQPNGTPCALGADAGTCAAGSCQVCTSGEKRCKAGGAATPQLCVGGQWVDQAACGGAAPVCLNGNCAQFPTGIDTTTGHVELTNTVGMTLGTSFSMAAWIKPSVAHTANIINNSLHGAYCGSIYISIGNPDQIWMTASDGAFPNKCANFLFDEKTTGGVTMPVGAWTHVVATVSNGNVIVYKNGASAGQWVGANIAPYPSIHNLWLGEGDGNPPLPPFKGRIAQVQVWARALTPAEVAQLFAQPGSVPANLAGLYGWWPINEGQGNTILDASGNGRTGQVVGATW